MTEQNSIKYVNLMSRDGNFRIPERIIGSDKFSYSVEERLGAGGNGIVHQCTRENDGEIFAVKFLTVLHKPARVARFLRETSVMNTLSNNQHDHLIKVITDGVIDATTKFRKKSLTKSIPFVIMEKADYSLREFLKAATNSVSYPIYIAQFRGLASALEMLHEIAIHRDIKPENILVVGERWVISDFGLCAMIEEEEIQSDITDDWEVIGPRFWMSPEANNRSVGLTEGVTFASDIFQLAAVFWWVVNRRHPSGILCREDWLGLDSLYEPMTKALQHSLNRRYGSASEFKSAIISAIES